MNLICFDRDFCRNPLCKCEKEEFWWFDNEYEISIDADLDDDYENVDKDNEEIIDDN